MTITRVLRGLLGTLALGGLGVQLLLPSFARNLGWQYAELRDVVAIYAALGISAVACIQFARYVTVRILNLSDTRDPAIAPQLIRWFKALTAAISLATCLSLLPQLHLLAFVGVGGPGVILTLLATAILGVTAVAGSALLKQLTIELVVLSGQLSERRQSALI